MPSQIYNFSAGPAVLPMSAVAEAQKHLAALPGVGLSVLEISHRSAACGEIMREAEANLRALLNIPENYRVLFLHGGASLQFAMIALNFLKGAPQPADYILTGSWGKKAVAEARIGGSVNIAWDGADDHYTRVPEPSELKLTPGAAYVHFTSNETIQGVQFAVEPDTGDVPLICDASSDILSRPLAVENYAMIYAGAQKNMGSAGVAVAIIRDDLLARAPDDQYAMLSYRVHAESGSLYNTPPVFAIYMVMLVTRWLKDTIGGLEKIQQINREKAQLLYDVIDDSDGFYRGHAAAGSRSLMNVTLRLPSEALETAFVEQAESAGMVGLKGHRSVGGLRVSLYNAMPLEGAHALRDFMRDFQRKNV